jgi:hypothetical protein
VQEPIVSRALGADWERLPEILRRNFALSPGTDCEVRLRGLMHEISYSRFGSLFVWPGRVFGALVPYQGRNVGIRIDIRTHASDERFMYWQRVHFFPEHPEFVFASRMEYAGGDELVERVRTGLGMRMKASLADGVLKFESVGYEWNLFGRRLRLPNWLLMGKGVILERQTGPDEFEMRFAITHPWWGRTFTYNGVFCFV